jgi:hypothetical protein
MDSIFPIVIVIIVLVLRAIGSKEKVRKNFSEQFEWKSFKMGPQLKDSSDPTVLALGVFGNKDLDKIVTVYGQGSQLSVDDVVGLLNITPEKAQAYLDELSNQGRAQLVQSTSGKIKYKLS